VQAADGDGGAEGHPTHLGGRFIQLPKRGGSRRKRRRRRRRGADTGAPLGRPHRGLRAGGRGRAYNRGGQRRPGVRSPPTPSTTVWPRPCRTHANVPAGRVWPRGSGEMRAMAVRAARPRGGEVVPTQTPARCRPASSLRWRRHHSAAADGKRVNNGGATGGQTTRHVAATARAHRRARSRGRRREQAPRQEESGWGREIPDQPARAGTERAAGRATAVAKRPRARIDDGGGSATGATQKARSSSKRTRKRGARARQPAARASRGLTRMAGRRGQAPPRRPPRPQAPGSGGGGAGGEPRRRHRRHCGGLRGARAPRGIWVRGLWRPPHRPITSAQGPPIRNWW